MVAIYDSTDGDNWDNNSGWLETDTPPCNWDGVTCDDELVTKLYFYGNNLNGILPSEIGNLTNLTYLGLGHNQLTSLPPEIGNLTNLTYLDLGHNQLTSLPPGIGNLTNLYEIILHSNQFSSLPPEIGNLTNLKDLWLNYNRPLNGPLPAYLTTFKQLNEFDFKGTDLCESQDKIFQDWLNNLIDVRSTDVDCLHLILTHVPDSAIDDIETFLNDNNVVLIIRLIKFKLF